MERDTNTNKERNLKIMDPYFRPILVSSAIVILLNTFLSLPIMGYPLVTYIAGGAIAVILFRLHKLKETQDEHYEIKASDATVLGIATGILVGSILTLILALNLQNPEVKQVVIDEVNRRMKMHSELEFKFMEDLGPSFYFISGLITIILTSVLSFFGSLMTLPFINKEKK